MAALGAAVASATVVALVAPTSAGAATAAPSTAHSVRFHLQTSMTGVSFVGEHQIPGGDYSATWRLADGEAFTVAAPQGATVVISQTGTKAGGTASARLIAPVYKQSPKQLAAAYAKADRSPAQDALAVGFSPASAAAVAAKPHLVHPMATTIWSGCVSTTGDSGHASGKACDTQALVQDLGGGNWYVSDEVTGSGVDFSGTNHLEAVAGYVNYGSGNSIVQYAPTGSVSFTSCGQSKTFSVSFAGQSFSSTTTDCPGTLNPYGLPSSTKFGSIFQTCDSGNQVDGVASDDVVHNPPYTAVSPDLTVQIWWGGC
jgi:hypothetical protein